MDLKVFFAGILIVACTVVTLAIGTIGDLYNQQNSLKQQIIIKQKNNQSEFDNMWKKIKQVSNVSDKYKDGFVEALQSYANARNNGKSVTGGSMVSINALHEAIPNLPNETYRQLNNVIISSRDDFTEQQKQLLDLEREYNTLVTSFPNVIIFKIMGIGEIHTQIVTSTRTESAFQAGKDDNVSL